MFDPQIVVGGGLGLAGGLYGEAPRAAIREHVWFDQACDLPVLPAATDLDAGLIGGAASIVVR